MLGQHYVKILCIQYCPNVPETALLKKITCAMLAQRNSYVFTGKQGVVFNMSGTHLASFFIGYNIKQSWLVLFNGGSGVHLQFMGEQ